MLFEWCYLQLLHMSTIDYYLLRSACYFFFYLHLSFEAVSHLCVLYLLFL